METQAALAEYLYSGVNWSDQTRKFYLSRLSRFVVWSKEQGIADTSGLTAMLAHRFYGTLREQGLASATMRGYGESIRAWYGWLVLEELIDERATKRLEVPKADKLVKRTLDASDFHKLFTAAEKGRNAHESARDVALLAVLADTGLRASELCTLRVDGVILTPQEGYLRVLGKGRKEREVGIGRKARAALVKYVNRYRRAADGVETVFTNRSGRPLTVWGLEKLIDRIATRADLGRKIHPHLFRHSYARHALTNGMDAYKLSRLLGHESLVITMNYLRDVRAAEARQGASILDAMTHKGR